MQTRKDLEQLERKTLAPFAAISAETRGRDYPVSPEDLRTEYQRDRDRIIHSAAFRKLEYKTQVYMIHEGDYYRTRLTHTIEVAQIARTIARNLRLNADLTEAVALAHDLGHTPFGHSGEAALRRLLKDDGGFDHNRQGLRIVERLEERFHDIPGLNLTWEVREGMAKHTTAYDSPHDRRFEPDTRPTLEAQVVDLADEIAYNHHDLDDALKLGIVTRDDLTAAPWIDEIVSCFERKAPSAGGNSGAMNKFIRFRLVGKMIDRSVRAVLKQTDKNIRREKVGSFADVRRCDHNLAAFTQEAKEQNRQLRGFLMERVYRHPNVVRMAAKAECFIERLFHLYHSNPRLLPLKFQNRIEAEGLKSVITDYISGMTDRFCREEYRRAFLPETDV